MLAALQAFRKGEDAGELAGVLSVLVELGEGAHQLLPPPRPGALQAIYSKAAAATGVPPELLAAVAGELTGDNPAHVGRGRVGIGGARWMAGMDTAALVASPDQLRNGDAEAFARVHAGAAEAGRQLRESMREHGAAAGVLRFLSVDQFNITAEDRRRALVVLATTGATAAKNAPAGTWTMLRALA